MAAVATFQATSLPVTSAYMTSAKSNTLPESVSFQHAWSTSKFLNGFTPLSRFSNGSFNTPSTKQHRNMGVAFARSSDQMERSLKLRLDDDTNVTSEPFGEKQLKITGNLTSKGTRKAFDEVLESLRRSAPPVEGFRKAKGGKSVVPREVLYQILGPSRVDKFVVEEIVTSAVLEYVEKEGIKAKEYKTVQSNGELAASFKAGKEFGFEAILELEDLEAEAADSQNQ